MRELNEPFNLDQVYALMMDALDGQMSVDGWHQLDTALRAHPDLAAEWQAMQTVDALFKRTPTAAPRIDFAERTMARLPNWRVRRWVMAAAFVAMWVTGLLPVFLLAWFFGAEVTIMAAAVWQISGAILNAVGQLLFNFGGYLTRYPAVMGSLLVMIGSITLWSGVYKQLMLPPAIAVRSS